MHILFHILAGLVLGYLVATLVESTFHRAIYHAGPRTRRLWAQHPLISGSVRRAYFSHGIVHHRWTFRRNFITQFRSEDERERLDQKIPGDQGSLIRRERYGATLRGVSVVWFYLPILPCLPFIGLVLGPWGLLGALPGLAGYSCIAIFVHPYLHSPHDEAVAEASPWLQWVLNTSYVKFLRRYHYLHHRYPDCNFNLLLGGDFVLGQYRTPTAQDWDEMCRLGLVVDERRRRVHVPPVHDAGEGDESGVSESQMV